MSVDGTTLGTLLQFIVGETVKKTLAYIFQSSYTKTLTPLNALSLLYRTAKKDMPSIFSEISETGPN